VLVTLSEYGDVRANDSGGVSALGHEDLTVERVVARNDRFVVTEKFGPAEDAFVAEANS
jgi:hypothetical protein